MAFAVEYVMVRNDTSVDFPLLSDSDQAAIENLRNEHNVNSVINISDDGLTWTMRQSTDTVSDYSTYYEKAGKYWDNSKIVARCSALNIKISMDVVAEQY